jgi:hypothetical protein
MSPKHPYDGPERRRFAYKQHPDAATEEERRQPRLSAEQCEEIKQQILASIYEDIGRSVVKKLLWAAGAVFVAVAAWAAAKGYLKP